MKLVAPHRVLVPPVFPNAGVEAAYRRVLRALVEDMCADVEEQIIPLYKRTALAMDETHEHYAGEFPSTRKFKEWFGDSKIVDANGKPLVCYHGTPTGGVNTFEQSGQRDPGWTGQGLYFTPDKDTAKAYTSATHGRSGKKQIYDVYIKADDPIHIKEMSPEWVSKALDKMRERAGRPPMTSEQREREMAELRPEWVKMGTPHENQILYANALKHVADPGYMAKTMGHDAVRADFDGGSIMVFNPNQIKSASKNSGNFGNTGNIYDAAPKRNPLVVKIRAMRNKWEAHFDEVAPTVAETFATQAASHADMAFSGALNRSGFSVPFKFTKELERAIGRRVSDNVGLIKSIPSEFFGEIQSKVMESVKAGRDLKHLSEHLQHSYGATKRRAEGIARDQNNKATAAVHQLRQKALGITQGVWRHTMASVHPRESHAAFDGETYNTQEGHDFDDGFGPVIPGEAINCGCVSYSIIPGYDEEEAATPTSTGANS